MVRALWHILIGFVIFFIKCKYNIYLFFFSNDYSPYIWKKLYYTVHVSKGTRQLQGKVVYYAYILLTPRCSHKPVFYLTESRDTGSMKDLYILYILHICKTHKACSSLLMDPYFSKQLSEGWKQLSVGSSHVIVRADPNLCLLLW